MTAEPLHLHATRTAYDTVAADYARLLSDELAAKPLDRAMLGAFAELVHSADLGPVVDLGCGPGRVTAHLDALGVDTFGIDLSPAMIAVARQAHPHLRFAEGSITDLDLDDAAVGGIVAWYSIIHTPPQQLPRVFAELHRILRPGGHVLLAFQVGDERVRIEQAYGHNLSVDAYRLPPDRVAQELVEAGLVVDAKLVREPRPPEKTPQAYLLASRR